MLRKTSDGGAQLVLKYYSLGGHVLGHPISRIVNGIDVIPVYAELPLQKSGRCRVGTQGKPDFSSLLSTEKLIVKTKSESLDEEATDVSDCEEKHSCDNPAESGGISFSFLSTDSSSDPAKRTKILPVKNSPPESSGDEDELLEDRPDTTRLSENAEALETAYLSSRIENLNVKINDRSIEPYDSDYINDENNFSSEDEDKNMPDLIDSLLLPEEKYEPHKATSESDSNWWDEDEDGEWPDTRMTFVEGRERKFHKNIYEEDSPRTEKDWQNDTYEDTNLLKFPLREPSYWHEEDSPRVSLEDEGPEKRRRLVNEKENYSTNNKDCHFSSDQSDVEFDTSSENLEECIVKSSEKSRVLNGAFDSVAKRSKGKKPILLETLEDAHHTVLAGPQSRVNVELVEVHRPEGALLNEEDQYDDMVLRNVSRDSDLTNVSEEIVRLDERTVCLRSCGAKNQLRENENIDSFLPVTEQDRTAVLNDQTIFQRGAGDQKLIDYMEKDSAIIVKSSIVPVGQPEPRPEEIVKESSIEVVERRQFVRLKEREDETSEELLTCHGNEIDFAVEDPGAALKNDPYPESPNYEDELVPRNVWVKLDEDCSPICPSCEDTLSLVDEELAGFEFPSDKEQLSSYVRSRERSGPSLSGFDTARMSSADATGDVSVEYRIKETGVQTEGTIEVVEFEEASSGCEEVSDIEFEFGTDGVKDIDTFDTPWGKEHYENHNHQHNHHHFFRHTHSHFVTEDDCEGVTEDLVNKAFNVVKNDKTLNIPASKTRGEEILSENDSDESQLLENSHLIVPENQPQLLSSLEDTLPDKNAFVHEDENSRINPAYEVSDKESIVKDDELNMDYRKHSIDEDEFAALRNGHFFPDFKEERDAVEPTSFYQRRYESFSDDKLRILQINKSVLIHKALRNVSMPCNLSIFALQPATGSRSVILSADLWQGPYTWEKQTYLHRAIVSLSLCAHGAKVPPELSIQNEVAQPFLSSKNDIQRSSVANRLLQSIILPTALQEQGVESFWWRIGTSGIFSNGSVIAINLTSGKLSCTFPNKEAPRTVAAACRCVGKAMDRMLDPKPVFFTQDTFYKSLFKEQKPDDVLLTPQEAVAAVKIWSVKFGVAMSTTSLVIREANLVRRGQQICCLYSIGTEPVSSNNVHQIPAVRIQAHHSDALNMKTKPWPVSVGHIKPKSLYSSDIEKAFSQGFWFLKRLHTLHADNSKAAPYSPRRSSTFSAVDNQRNFPTRSPSIPGPSFLESRRFSDNLHRHTRSATMESRSTNRSHESLTSRSNSQRFDRT
eukprot:GHVP01067584.1.p1 GENE.GHVP01067584.1~~GHVP01067584.1.p1  ORF type:complete len:1288 (-),score=273.50 GHVP01067584.1:88-3951(-)